MRNGLLALALAALTGLVGAARAQAPQRPDSATAEFRERLAQLVVNPTVEAQVELMQLLQARLEAGRRLTTCAGPGNASVALNEEIFFDGRAYRCVEVFEPNEAPGMANAPLRRRSVGLVRVGQQGQ